MQDLSTKKRTLLGPYLIIAAVHFLAFEIQAQTLSSFKDSLFKYSKTLSIGHNGDYKVIQYNETRDVNGQDEVPVKKAKAERVDESVLSYQRHLKIGKMKTFEVGNPSTAEWSVIFIHGAVEDKTVAAQDWTFGGNFNRLKNLAVRSKGTYYAPEVTFSESGIRGVVGIMDHIQTASPRAKIIIACGSAGGYICSELAKQSKYVNRLAGLMYMGSGKILSSLKNPAIEARLPIMYLHGSKDKAASVNAIYKQFDALKQSSRSYPVQMVVFDNGAHGTPIRMVDWKENIKLIVAQR